MKAAIRTGIFGAVLAGTGFLLSGLMCNALSLNPLVSFTMAAGVLAPMAMVFSGVLARWARHCPFGEQPQGPDRMASLASGLTTAALIAAMFASMLALPGSFSQVDGLGLGSFILPGAAVLLAAYVAMAVIGGELYGFISNTSLRF